MQLIYYYYISGWFRNWKLESGISKLKMVGMDKEVAAGKY
jgi:hypothetical protein